MTQSARLALLAALAVTTLVFMGAGFAPALTGVSWLGYADIAIAALTFIQFRHIGQTAIAVFAPFAGLVWADSILKIAGSQSPGVLAHAIGLCFGVAVATLVSDIGVRRVTEGSAKVAPLPDLHPVLPAAGATAALVIAALASFAAFFPSILATLALAVGFSLVCAGAFAFIGAVLAFPWFHYSEDFVARINRAGEYRARLLGNLDELLKPRWCFSLCGIALILAALGGFGACQLRTDDTVSPSAPALWAVLVVLTVAASFAVSRDWRRSIAVPLAMAPPVMLGLCALTKVGIAFDLRTWLFFAASLATFFFLFAALASRGGASPRSGANPQEAFADAWEKQGVWLVFATALSGLILACAFFAADQRLAFALAVLAVSSGTSAFFFLPAFAGAIESLFPRRHALEELYRPR